MVQFSICEGNPGALSFLMAAYDTLPFAAEAGFSRMHREGIRGDRLYMLWNDCCERNTLLAIRVMQSWPVSEILRRINCQGGYGLPISADEFYQYGPPSIRF